MFQLKSLFLDNPSIEILAVCFSRKKELKRKNKIKSWKKLNCSNRKGNSFSFPIPTLSTPMSLLIDTDRNYASSNIEIYYKEW